MDKVSELRPGGGYELKVKYVNKTSYERWWKCFACGEQGRWLFEKEFMSICPNCGEKPSEEKGKGVWLQHKSSVLVEDDTGKCYMDLWNEEIEKFKEGDIIHVINGYARENSTGGVNISSGKYGHLKKVE
jgi:hypothetical protein